MIAQIKSLELDCTNADIYFCQKKIQEPRLEKKLLELNAEVFFEAK